MAEQEYRLQPDNADENKRDLPNIDLPTAIKTLQTVQETHEDSLSEEALLATIEPREVAQLWAAERRVARDIMERHEAQRDRVTGTRTIRKQHAQYRVRLDVDDLLDGVQYWLPVPATRLEVRVKDGGAVSFTDYPSVPPGTIYNDERPEKERMSSILFARSAASSHKEKIQQCRDVWRARRWLSKAML